MTGPAGPHAPGDEPLPDESLFDEPPSDEPPSDEPLPEERRKRGIIVDGLWSATSSVVPIIGTAALSVVMGRVLGADQLGQQSLIAYVEAMVTVMTVAVLTDTAIQTLSAARGAGDTELYDRLSRWATATLGFSGLLAAAVVTTIGLFTDDPLPWFVASLSTLVNGLGWSYGARIVAEQGWSYVSARRLITQTLAQVLAIAVVLAGGGIVGVFAANLVAALLLLLLLRRRVDDVAGGAWRPFPRAAVAIWWRFLLVQGIFQVVSSRIEFLFLGVMSTDQQIAMYSIAFMLVSSAALVPVTFFNAGLPRVAESSGAGTLADALAHLAPAIRVVSVVSLLLTAGAIVAGPPLIELLYGPAFAESAALVPVLAVSLVVVPAGELCTVFWMGAGRTRVVVIAGIVGGAVDLALAFVLVSRYDALGAAVANTVGQSLTAAVTLALTWRRAGRFRWAAPRWLMSAAVAAVATGLGLAVVHALAPLGGLLLGSLVLVAVLAAWGLLVGYVDRDDAAWLSSVLPGRLAPVGRVLTGRARERDTNLPGG